MIPVSFEGVNKTLISPLNWDKESHGKCIDLPVQFKDGICKSCWKLSFKEILKLFFGQRIYLSMVSNGSQPPVMLLVEKSNAES